MYALATVMISETTHTFHDCAAKTPPALIFPFPTIIFLQFSSFTAPCINLRNAAYFAQGIALLSIMITRSISIPHQTVLSHVLLEATATMKLVDKNLCIPTNPIGPQSSLDSSMAAGGYQVP